LPAEGSGRVVREAMKTLNDDKANEKIRQHFVAKIRSLFYVNP
jgi:hypothetical protein